MNFNTLTFHANRLLGRMQPDALLRPEPVDLRPWLREAEFTLGVRVEHRSASRLGDVEGFFEPDSALIVLRDDVWEALHERSDATHRARSTFAHELSHWNLDGISMSEDDAWAHAGCLMMPCEMVQTLEVIDDVTVSKVFDVSPQFAYRHLWRMKKARLL